ncbi:MAG TPA: hypothetical protein VF893_05385 [Candidatus Bathyarchaeia archaeon]
MPKLKITILLLLTTIFSATLAPTVLSQAYYPGVSTGHYVKYGNFIGVGPGVESFNDYDWLKLEITAVSGKEVTLFSMGQFKNGTAIPGNGTTTVWNIEKGTEDGVPSTQGPIIAGDLSQGDAIPPQNTYTINKTEDRTYLGVSRSVNILDVSISTPDYNSTLTYVYDRLSGMLLESRSETTTQAQPKPITTEYSYSIIETNVYGASSIAPIPLVYVVVVIAVAVVVVVAAAILALRKKKT